MRFHVVALPHTQTTSAFNICAYTNKVIGFCTMMRARGHEVFLYAGEENEAPCTEHITCISENARKAIVGDKPYVEASFDYSLPHWQRFNLMAAGQIAMRCLPHDFLCIIGGLAQKQISDILTPSFPQLMTVEWGIGYGGTFAARKVFESYAWMHMHYGHTFKQITDVDGDWYDAVIPGYLDPNDFPFKYQSNGPYYLYIGRMTDRKGYKIAQAVCEKLGASLVLAGPGTVPTGYGRYVGTLGIKERGVMMAGAQAVFVPTHYIEPFGNVAIEAMCCGTPVITTDWGAFTETVIHGQTGFRCRTMQEFLDAAVAAPVLNPHLIRAHVVANYSLDVVGVKYEEYFERLSGLWGEGWTAMQLNGTEVHSD